MVLAAEWHANVVLLLELIAVTPNSVVLMVPVRLNHGIAWQQRQQTSMVMSILFALVVSSAGMDNVSELII